MTLFVEDGRWRGGGLGKRTSSRPEPRAAASLSEFARKTWLALRSEADRWQPGR
jgi:hypothetical protein